MYAFNSSFLFFSNFFLFSLLRFPFIDYILWLSHHNDNNLNFNVQNLLCDDHISSIHTTSYRIYIFFFSSSKFFLTLAFFTVKRALRLISTTIPSVFRSNNRVHWHFQTPPPPDIFIWSPFFVLVFFSSSLSRLNCLMSRFEY